MMSRDPKSRRAVRTYRQIESEFRKLDKKEIQVRAKYEPVQKGDPPKEPGTSHRFANVLIWEDDISVFRNIGKGSRTGERDIRPGTAPQQTLTQALNTAFSPEVLPDEIKESFHLRAVAEDGNGEAAPQKPRRWSADPRSKRRPQTADGQTLRIEYSLGADATHGSIGASPETLPNGKNVQSNGIIHRRPPSGSIATARARRIMSAKHFRAPVTKEDTLSTTVGDLQEVDAEYFKSSRRPQSARPVRRRPSSRCDNEASVARDPTAEAGYRPFEIDEERMEMAGMSPPRKIYTKPTGKPPTPGTWRPSTAQSHLSSNNNTPRSGGRIMSARSHVSTNADTWSRMSNTVGDSSSKGAPALATDEDVHRGIQGMMEVGQSVRYERAIQSAKREMLESISIVSGVPIKDNLEYAWNSSSCAEDDEVVIEDTADQGDAPSPSAHSKVPFNNRYAGCTEAEQLEQIEEDKAFSRLPEQQEDEPSQEFSVKSIVPPLRPQSALIQSERSMTASRDGHASTQGSENSSSHASAKSSRPRPMTAPTKRRSENRNTATERNRNSNAQSLARTSHWRTSMPRKPRPKSSTAMGARNRASTNAAPAALHPAADRPPSPVVAMKSDGARRDMIMSMMVSGIRSQQPEDEPELDVQTRSMELQDRDSMEFPKSAVPSRLRPSSPAPMWVLSPRAEGTIKDVRSILETLPGGHKNVQRHAEAPISSRVSRDASRSMTGAAREGSAPPHLLREFYHLEVTVGPEDTGGQHVSMSDWRFDVTVKQVDGDGPSMTAGRNLRVNNKNQIVFRPGNEQPTIFSPVDTLPWILSPEELYRKTLQIVVVSTTPQIREVLNMTVWLGPWDEEPELVTVAPPSPDSFNAPQSPSLTLQAPPLSITDTESVSSSLPSSPSPVGRSVSMRLPSSVEGLSPPWLDSRNLTRKLSGAGARPASAKAAFRAPAGSPRIPCAPGSPAASGTPVEPASMAPYDAVSLTSNRRLHQRAQSTSSGTGGLVSTAAASIDDLLQSRDEIILKLRSLSAGQELPVTTIGTVVSSS